MLGRCQELSDHYYSQSSGAAGSPGYPSYSCEIVPTGGSRVVSLRMEVGKREGLEGKRGEWVWALAS